MGIANQKAAPHAVSRYQATRLHRQVGCSASGCRPGPPTPLAPPSRWQLITLWAGFSSVAAIGHAHSGRQLPRSAGGPGLCVPRNEVSGRSARGCQQQAGDKLNLQLSMPRGLAGSTDADEGFKRSDQARESSGRGDFRCCHQIEQGHCGSECRLRTCSSTREKAESSTLPRHFPPPGCTGPGVEALARPGRREPGARWREFRKRA